MNLRRLALGATVLIAAFALALGIRALLKAEQRTRIAQPRGIMGTSCALTAVSPEGDPKKAEEALARAEQALRRVEARMSTYIELSELSRLNAAPADRAVKLSPDTMEVLKLSRALCDDTRGAFDVTCLPLFRLWSKAGKADRLPTEAERAAAKAACGWGKWLLSDVEASKTVDGAGLGLGGVAKGWGIDKAVEAMQEAGCVGGLVDVGGDIRCFGEPERGGKWIVAIRSPFAPRGGAFFGTLAIGDGAVCTSGNYERFSVIGGKRYSHIIDPRTGMPVDSVPSVTVVGPTATVADAWATALSVLGPDGLTLLPAGVEAMLVVGGPDGYAIHQSPGLAGLLDRPVPRREDPNAAP